MMDTNKRKKSEAEVEAANDHNKMLIDRIRGMPAQPGGLSEEIGWLLEEIEEQKAKIDRLRADNENLQKAWHDAECGRDRLRAENAKLLHLAESRLKACDEYWAEIDRLRAEVAEMIEVLRAVYYDDDPPAHERAYALIARHLARTQKEGE